MVKHNNMIPNGHFHKKWQDHVKTWFHQPGQKKARRLRRLRKAAIIAPRPINGLLRPAVRCPTIRYNMRLRIGRGFTLEELREAGIHPKDARNIGISVDHRRRNHSVEQFQRNILRLKEYKDRLILFSEKSSKKGEVHKERIQPRKEDQLKGDIMPITQDVEGEKERLIKPEERKASAFYKLRQARSRAYRVHFLEVLRKKQLDKDKI
jgi:large subunit ribosomal protein L13e